jgi:hypothetical protein
VYHNRRVESRVKRTYNLSAATVRIVRELAGEYRVARSQDAVVELAVDELRRRLRDAEEAALWEGAASDPAFRADAEAIDSDLPAASAETWPA